MTTTTEKPLTIEQRARRSFESETPDHGVTALLDDGVYRHLRCQKPGTYIYGFDITTWPGHLAITGDCGTYVFSRLNDMFEFFGPLDERYGINPHYWGEKLVAPRGRDAVMKFDDDAAREWVEQWMRDRIEEHADIDEAAFRSDVQWEVLDALSSHAEHEFRTTVRDYRYELSNGERVRFHQDDHWDMSWDQYDFRFLWCCWAIVWAIREYRAAAATVERSALVGASS